MTYAKNASSWMPPSLGRLLHYYYTSLPASWVRHFMPFPVLFYAVYLWQHSEEVGIENKKGWNLSGWWFFCFVIPVWSVLKIVSYGMEVSFGMYHTRTCFAMGRSKMKPLWMRDGNCRTTDEMTNGHVRKLMVHDPLNSPMASSSW